VAERPFYHVCLTLFFLVSALPAYEQLSTAVTDGANVLAVRSRTTRSSKSRVCLLSHFSHSTIILILATFLLHPPPLPPSHVLSLPFTIFSFMFATASSSRIQKPTHNNSRNNSVSSGSMRPTQSVTEIAFFVPFQINCMAPSLATSSSARTFVIGYSHTAYVMHPLLMMSVAWMFTFPSCDNLVRPHLCSFL